jgi:hypothetical protein
MHHSIPVTYQVVMLAGDTNHALGKPKLACLTGWENCPNNSYHC